MLYNHFTEAAFYIYFLICSKTKNKQLPNSNCLHSISHFNSLPQLLTKSLFVVECSFQPLLQLSLAIQ